MILHPNALTLSRFSDGDLPAWRAKRVAAHLEACAVCRAVVASMREFGAAARSAAAPNNARVACGSALRSGAGGGERAILPAGTAGAPTLSRRWIAVAVAAFVLAAVGFLARPLVRHAAAADRAALRILAGKPATGRFPRGPLSRRSPAGGGAHAARARTLLLLVCVQRRVRFLSGRAASSSLRSPRTPMARSAGRSSSPTPPCTSLLIVENDDGSQIDSNHCGLFDLVSAAPNGRPSFAGLLARAMRGTVACCIPGTNGRALVAAESLVAIYPDSAQSWATRCERRGVIADPALVERVQRARAALHGAREGACGSGLGLAWSR